MSTEDAGGYSYNDWSTNPDPPHQPLYLSKMLAHLRSETNCQRVLDAGCGDGNFAESLSVEGFEMFGLDMSAVGIEIAKSRTVGEFRVASMYDDFRQVFQVPHFDAVVAIETVEHLYSPVTFARRAYESVRPGGKVIVTTPYWGYTKNVVLALTNRIDRNLTPMWEGGHIKHWSRRTMTQLLEGAGFRVVAFEGAGRFPPLWKGMMMVGVKPDQTNDTKLIEATGTTSSD